MASGVNSKKKILILSNSNPYKIAGVVANDFLKALNTDDLFDTKLLIRMWDKKKSNNVIYLDSFFSFYYKKYKELFFFIAKRLRIYSNKLLKTNPNYSVQDYDQTITYYNTSKILSKVNFSPDYIIVLFMQKFLSFKNLYELQKKTNAKIFLIPLDMAPFTGGCHYAWNCNGYKNNCETPCPAMGEIANKEYAKKNLEYKKQFVSKMDIEIVSCSSWLYNRVIQSSIFREKKNHKALLPIDEKIFKPKKTESERIIFPEDKIILFFGATSVSNKRKGLPLLIEALNTVRQIGGSDLCKQIHLVIAGNGLNLFADKLPFDYTDVGFVDIHNLSLIFNKVNVFLCPSVEDAGPMMINQSILSGVPVIAFNVGVAKDIIVDDITGYCVEQIDSTNFAKSIIKFINKFGGKKEEISKRCREYGMNLYSLKQTQLTYMKIL